MENIRKIFLHDLRTCRKNVIGCVVLLGLVVVPALYAWFNIAGSWDPYGNTGQLKIAVANADEGYKGDLVPVRVTVGAEVEAKLRANDSFDWVFTGKDDAVEGVKSGKYYAAVVIPESFSADMMTFFSPNVTHAQIKYYVNEKENAIAPRVTAAGADAVQEQVDQMFAEVLGEVGLSTASNLIDYMDSDDASTFVANLTKRMNDSILQLADASSSADSLAQLMGSTSDLVSSTAKLLKDSGGTSAQSAQLLDKVKTSSGDVSGSLSDASKILSDALAQSAGSMDSVDQAIDKAYGSVGKQSADTASQLKTLADDIDRTSTAYKASAQAIRDRYDPAKNTQGSPLTPAQQEQLQKRANAVADRIDDAASRMGSLRDALRTAADSLTNGTSGAGTTRDELKAQVAQAKKGVTDAKSSYDSQLKAQVAQLGATVSDVGSRSQEVSKKLDDAVQGLSGTSGSLGKELSDAKGQIGDASKMLGDAAKKLQDLKDKLAKAMATDDVGAIKELIGSDPESLAKTLSAPVGLQKHEVYPIRNYGSAMAPFYTTLAIWVGGVVMAAMLKTGVSSKVRRAIAPYRLHELYLGRFGLFACISLAQSTLVCLGDILFLGIQCDHPLLFLLDGWLAGLVFAFLIYTLTVSFGDVGKAIAVVLMVMQVAGSGGTFPIEMFHPVFQAIYPWLPFTHSIAAMHAAMAGSYGAEYWIELLKVLAYVIPSLALGLVLRRPVIRFNNFVSRKIEETKVM